MKPDRIGKRLTFFIIACVIIFISTSWASDRVVEKEEVYFGYSKTIMPIRNLVAEGKIEEALNIVARNNNKAKNYSRNDRKKRNTAHAFDFEKNVLREGMSGPIVVELQKSLNNKGYKVWVVDGIFGSGTKSSVIRFQRANGLDPDGIVGSRTWDELYKDTEEQKNYNQNMSKNKKSPIKSSELRFLESGILAIESGNPDQAEECFSCAEHLFAMQEKGTHAERFLKGFLNVGIEIFSGNTEHSRYKAEGYEKVIMLNYKSISYLLQGERKAYNVARRSINLQKRERKRFEKKIESAKKKIAKHKEEGNAKNNSKTSSASKMILDEYAPMRARALTLPSAYVNPFGYYVSGLVQEFESFDDTSLRANARISYQKALDLNPKSEVLQDAVKDLTKSYHPSGKRLVHVVAADGFSPEKKLLVLPIVVEGKLIPITLPIYRPVSSQVDRIEVCDAKGAKLADFSTVADIEALCLRQQEDIVSSFFIQLVSKIIIDYLVSKLMASLLGGELDLATQNKIAWASRYAGAPDMRSWMLLPASIQAARFYVPKWQKTINIVTYDDEGKKLASQVVNLDRSSHNFVYVRSIDNILYAYSNKKLWVAN